MTLLSNTLKKVAEALVVKKSKPTLYIQEKSVLSKVECVSFKQII